MDFKDYCIFIKEGDEKVFDKFIPLMNASSDDSNILLMTRDDL